MVDYIYIKVTCTWLLLLALVTVTYAQNTKGLKPVTKQQGQSTEVTRAVVVGISDYQNDQITDLEYAHIDANMFAEYLMEDKSWSVDSSHITVLLNQEATSGKFVAALFKVMEESNEGDRVVIYFSGHGDVETTLMNQPGYLLCWDAPAQVYMAGGTFSLQNFQNIVSTLSIQEQVNVLIITDACRSGKLAGHSIGGAQATAINLSQQFANEAKILSCQPDEFALEGKEWGGGRGVFSYYLLAGLRGMADLDGNGQVELREIERYLEDQVSTSVAPHSQIPFSVGNHKTIISKVDPEVLASLQTRGLDYQMQKTLTKSGLIHQAMFQDTGDYRLYLAFENALAKNHLLSPYEGSAHDYYSRIKNFPELQEYVPVITRNLAAALQDDAQQAINDYLAADPSELKARWTYDDKYQLMSASLDTAAVLLGETHFFYNTIKARALYFKGLTLRIQAEYEEEPSYFAEAEALQLLSLSYDSLAPHTLNELGLLSGKMDKIDQSLEYHQEAIELSPNWILGKSNLVATYLYLNDANIAVKMGLDIVDKDSSFLFNLLNLSLAYKKLDKVDSAEYYLQQAIKQDTSYVSAYSALGDLYKELGKLAEAVHYYQKAIALRPSEVRLQLNLAQIYLGIPDTTNARKYFQQAFQTKPSHLGAIQGLIEYDYYTQNFGSAQLKLEKYLASHPEDSFAHFLLASIYAKNEDEYAAKARLALAKAHGFEDIDLIYSLGHFDELLKKPTFKSHVEGLFKK